MTSTHLNNSKTVIIMKMHINAKQKNWNKNKAITKNIDIMYREK